MSRLLLFVFAATAVQSSFAQVDKRLTDADKSFAAGDYYTAAKLYEQFLHPVVKEIEPANLPINARRHRQSTGMMGKGVTKNDLLFKQAECFRLANYWQEAAARYKEVAEKDPANYNKGLYWYAVCQRSLGNYNDAEESLNKFLAAATANDLLRPVAEKELQTLKYIKSQLVRPDTVLYNVKKLSLSSGSGKGVYAPLMMKDGQLLVTSTQTDTAVKEGINPYHNRLFTATLSNGVFQNEEELKVEGVDAAVNIGTASVNPVNGVIYFTQWKKEGERSVSAIYAATKTADGLSTPVLLSSVNQTGYNSKQPFCTADGKYLFFASDRPGGAGKFDIWFAAINADGSIAEAKNVKGINTEADEQAPFVHAKSNSLVFSSDGMQGMGGFDLFVSKGIEDGWQTPQNMGHPVNSTRDDIYFTTDQETAFYKNALLSSDRGSECCLETYAVTKAAKKKFLTGIVYDRKDNTLLSNAEVLLKNSNGKTWKQTTDANGRYTFEVTDENNEQITTTKELYKENTTAVTVEKINEGWLEDVLTNAPIYVEKKLVIKVENVVTVYFDFDKSNLKEPAVNKLDSIYNVLVENPTATIQISGYTDGRGTEEYNKILSDKRAKACADYLIGKGIDAGRITFESFGACCPVEMELINGRDNAEGRSKNRRALINIDKKE
ncbi:MAG: OmpA family protein [Lacibacter sp.]